MTSAADRAWIQTVLDYMNGKDGSAGGPTFTGNQQPTSGSWWQFGSAPGQDPSGILSSWSNGEYQPAQQEATDQLIYKPTAPATPIDKLVLGISEDAWRGDARYTVSVDGTQIGSVRTAIMSHAAGASQQVTIDGAWLAGPHSIVVTFINDAYGGTSRMDRNLYVDSVRFDGAAIAGAPKSLLHDGAATFMVSAPTPADFLSLHSSASFG